MHLSYAKSKSYGYIVDDIKGMYTCCEVSKKHSKIPYSLTYG